MTVKEFLKLWEDDTHADIDVYDNVVEEIGIAYCGGYKLTPEGISKFRDVLELNIDVDEDNCIAILDIDDEDGIWQNKLKKAKEFFYAAAGYCDCNDYDKWFTEA